MKDIFFYPLALLIIAGIIIFALSFKDRLPPLTKTEILAQGFVLENEGLQRLTASPGTMIEFTASGSKAILTSHIARDIAPPSAGVFATLGEDYESAFAETLLEIQVKARLVDPLQAASLEIGYFSAGSGDSGWKAFALTETVETYTLYFRPGPVLEQKGQDYIGLWPDPKGQQIPIEVTSISVKPSSGNEDSNL